MGSVRRSCIRQEREANNCRKTKAYKLPQLIQNPAASSTIARQSRKEIREKKLSFPHFVLLCTFARLPAFAFLFNLI